MSAVLDGNLIASEAFAKCLCAFYECSEEMQQVIVEMAKIANDSEATTEEREAAIATIAEALFPSGVQSALGIDLEESESLETEEGKATLEEMNQEEATFADRLTALLEEKGVTPSELASAIGVGPSAISLMLA